MTICLKCQHHQAHRFGLWLFGWDIGHYCAAPENALEPVVDTVTGTVLYRIPPADSRPGNYSDSSLSRCHLVNQNGNCPHFQPIQEPEL